MLLKPNFFDLLELEIPPISMLHLVMSLRRLMRRNGKASGHYLSSSQGTVIRNPQGKLFPAILINIGLLKYIIIREQLGSPIGIKCMMQCSRTTSSIKVPLKSGANLMQT
uniref:Ovule protein n=1 Tax=Loa loa TaxID=7209 RepID=A0A1I7VUL8_LOALO